MFGVSNGSVMKVKVFYLKNEKILLSIVVFPVCIEFSATETKCALKRQILFHTLYVHFSSKKAPIQKHFESIFLHSSTTKKYRSVLS